MMINVVPLYDPGNIAMGALIFLRENNEDSGAVRAAEEKSVHDARSEKVREAARRFFQDYVIVFRNKETGCEFWVSPPLLPCQIR